MDTRLAIALARRVDGERLNVTALAAELGSPERASMSMSVALPRRAWPAWCLVPGRLEGTRIRPRLSSRT